MEKRLPLMVLLVLLSWQTPVMAQGNVSPEKKAKAQKLFEEAEKQYYLGRFPKALQLYSRAYELAPLPGFLFNIGQCHRMMGNYDKAVFFYRGYLRATDAANRSVVEKLIKECQAKARHKQASKTSQRKPTSGGAIQPRPAASAAPSGSPPGPTALKRSSDTAAAQVARHRGNDIAKSGPEEPRKRSKRWYKTWWFWTAVGVGVAVLAGGTVGGIMASRSGSTGSPSGSLGTIDRR